MLIALALILTTLVHAATVPDVDAASVSVRASRRDAALVIGNDTYAHLPAATWATQDADAVTTWLTSFGGVASNRVVRLRDARTTEIVDAVGSAAAAVRRGGTLWVYYAGHGAAGAEGTRLLLGSDASAAADEVGGVSLAWLVDALGRAPADHVVVMIDAGFGGMGREGEELYLGQRFSVASSMAVPDNVVLWMATSGAEPAAVWPDAHHGLYTWCALGALRGWADGRGGSPRDRHVQMKEAQTYTAKLVHTLGGATQRPTKDLREEVAEWRLARALEPAPPEGVIKSLAEAARTRRVQAAQDVLIARADADWALLQVALAQIPPRAPGAPAPDPDPAEVSLRAFLTRYDSATVRVDGQDHPVIVPQVAEARAKLDALARAKPKPAGKGRRGRGRPRVAAPAPVVADVGACRDLVALEPLATAGTLSPEQRTCVDTRIDTEASQTTRDTLSRLLLVDADARGDDLEWMRLAARHLDAVDRSDPDLCLKYALLLSRGEIDDAPDVIRWAEVGLENKQRWEGTTFTTRVYALHRLRAESAVRLWEDAEQRQVAAPAEVDAAEVELLRGRARDAAREWLDFARSTGQAVDRPKALCASAAGTTSFCGEL